MKSQAYKITGFAAVMGALGFMLRWLQGMRIYDEATGLADRSAGINVWVIVLLVGTLAALAVWSVLLRKYEPVRDHKALVGKSFLYRLIGRVAGGLLALAGFWLLFAAGRYEMPFMQRMLAAFEIFGGVSAILLAAHADASGQVKTRRVAAVLLVLCGCMFMVTVYRENAANPVLWEFAPEILALCAATLALYYTAGYQFGQAKPFCGIFFCHAGLFLCMLCVTDMGLSPQAAAYAALALLLGMQGFVQTANLSRKES